ncbi:MAG TPA: site-2 protease family protein [Methylomirabilota bacterium]|nr:site-2 protease family protein [Methylomirabilota bacterium]
MPFWSRQRPEEPPSWDELFPLEALLRRQLDDVLVVQDRRILGRSLAFGGRLLVEPTVALERLRPRLAPHGYTPFLREDQGTVWVHALAQVDAVEPSRPLVHLGLFLATVVTTLLAGTLILGGVSPGELWAHPGRIAVGLPFAAALLGILGVHEFGHYTLGRRHGMPVSLPYFIPVPPVPPFLLGTLGAVIRLRGAIRDRRALFDMAVAGPLAGLVVAVPIYVLGLKLSTVVRIPQGPAEGAYVQFGDAVLPKLIERLTLGPLPSDFDILLHPVGVAAWFGFFVTALNLIPAGQLDGGHIVYALFGSRHALISKLAVGGLVLIGLAFGSINWLVWAALIVGIMGFRHGPTMDDVTPLDGRRRALGLFALVLLFLLLPPVPLSVR